MFSHSSARSSPTWSPSSRSSLPPAHCPALFSRAPRQAGLQPLSVSSLGCHAGVHGELLRPMRDAQHSNTSQQPPVDSHLSAVTRSASHATPRRQGPCTGSGSFRFGLEYTEYVVQRHSVYGMWHIKHKDPTNYGFWKPTVLGLRTRMLDPYVYVCLVGLLLRGDTCGLK